MKTIIALSALLAFTFAEPPPSNSYLPPSPNQRSNGYSNGGYPSGGSSTLPQVVAARNLGTPHGREQAFGRNSQASAPHGAGPRGRLSAEQGYDQNASPFARNAIDQYSSEPANYNFKYMVNDGEEGTDFGHQEEREDESAHGEYHVVLPDGRKQTVSYEADERGFKPRISYEDSDNFSRNGGYDDNAQNGNGYHGNAQNGGGYRSNGARSNGYN